MMCFKNHGLMNRQACSENIQGRRESETMNQEQRRLYLIRYLLNEQPRYRNMEIPSDEVEQRHLLRSLFNIRMPGKISDKFLDIQDEYLKEEAYCKGITDLKNLKPVRNQTYLWKGDITALKCDAIVNAANSAMLGCFVPCHNCIDNSIHTYAGIKLRNECASIMKKQGHEEEAGKAKITSAYNLPCRYVIHTVGPIICDKVRKEDEKLLSSCYESCLKLADENGVRSIAFCCISTGEFRFPNQAAARIAIWTVEKYMQETKSEIEVIFNVFKDIDDQIYWELLG